MVHGLKLLDSYRGIVQCDGYAAYKTIADKAPGKAITLAFCWAHLRRHFFDIAKVIRLAIFRRRRQIVANSVCCSGFQLGMAARRSSNSQ